MTRPFRLPNGIWTDAEAILSIGLGKLGGVECCQLNMKPDGKVAIHVLPAGDVTASQIVEAVGVVWQRTLGFYQDPEVLAAAYRAGWDACWEETDSGTSEEEAEKLLDESTALFLEEYRT